MQVNIEFKFTLPEDEEKHSIYLNAEVVHDKLIRLYEEIYEKMVDKRITPDEKYAYQWMLNYFIEKFDDFI